MVNPSPERTPTAIETIEDQPQDQQQLRQRLLQLIVKSEAKRRSAAEAKIVAMNRPPAGPHARSVRNKLGTKGTAKKRA